MIVRRNLQPRMILHYTWRQLTYYLVLSTSIVILHDIYEVVIFNIPSYTIAALGTALAIFLGFKNDHAYDRWWEARKIWGLMVNYSRAWARQATTLVMSEDGVEHEEIKAFQKTLVYRHIAFVNALRVFLRKKNAYNKDQSELFEDENTYADTKSFLSEEEYNDFCNQDNPPNYLLQRQGEELKHAFQRGWISDYRFIKMEETLVDFNDIQGMSERIKNTPLPRQYTFFSRVFVLIHCTLLPMVFVSELGWKTIPIALAVSFVFLALDLIGERTEDPFENRLEDTPMTSLSLTIETNLKEQLKESHTNFPQKYQPEDGIVF
ncbi:bestrophin family protein [Pararhodonellum marinum]|uniref:bestrophin family protein n=1 Tax=Pararhodonellum marinum TaxID=2755358 RepID=UPI00188F2174|nr:bestrophin family ion channel [Pararhodonellum marinum]